MHSEGVLARKQGIDKFLNHRYSCSICDSLQLRAHQQNGSALVAGGFKRPIHFTNINFLFDHKTEVNHDG